MRHKMRVSADLAERSSQIGGIPVDQLQRAFRGGRRQLTAFPADDGIPLPPTAPATVLEVLAAASDAANLVHTFSVGSV